MNRRPIKLKLIVPAMSYADPYQWHMNTGLKIGMFSNIFGSVIMHCSEYQYKYDLKSLDLGRSDKSLFTKTEKKPPYFGLLLLLNHSNLNPGSVDFEYGLPDGECAVVPYDQKHVDGVQSAVIEVQVEGGQNKT